MDLRFFKVYILTFVNRQCPDRMISFHKSVFWQSDSSNYIYHHYWQGIVVMNVKFKPWQTLPFPNPTTFENLCIFSHSKPYQTLSLCHPPTLCNLASLPRSKPYQTLPFCELLCPALNLQNWIPQMLAIPFPNIALSGELALMFPILFGKFGMGCLSQIAVTCPPLYLNKT